MCGRYSIGPEIETLVEKLKVALPPDFAPHYNAAPSQHLPVVSNRHLGQVTLPVGHDSILGEKLERTKTH